MLQVSSASGDCKKSEAQDAGCVFYHMCQACQDDLRCMWDKATCKPRTGAGEFLFFKTLLFDFVCVCICVCVCVCVHVCMHLDIHFLNLTLKK